MYIKVDKVKRVNRKPVSSAEYAAAHFCVTAVSLDKITADIRVNDIKAGDTVKLRKHGDIQFNVISKREDTRAPFCVILQHDAINGGLTFPVTLNADGTAFFAWAHTLSPFDIIEHTSVVKGA